MRSILLVISAVITIALIFLLNTSINIAGSKTPRLGTFLSPTEGFWKNAEPVNTDLNEEVSIAGLNGKTEVYFDERLVPHVYAENENDAYFVQGYLHAKFRLWQMEFQTHAAAGRLSEIMGEGKAFLEKDRFFRRLGMLYSAEQSLKLLEANEVTKGELDAYTNGVNAYIEKLSSADYPLEYKLLDYKPEKWTNLKTELFYKYMSYELAGFDSDFEMTNAKSLFSGTDIEKLYPISPDSLDPVVTKGTPFAHASLTPQKPANADSVYLHFKNDPGSANINQPDKNNGSNNWAVAGSKTKSGAPILCNDPHLGLSLPSLWYEMQISTPTFNTYGATFPGSPSVIIGFNDSCAWGVTNASRDVKDYYEIQFRDSTMQEYMFNGRWKKTEFRNEIIKIKGKADVTEKIAVTALGPVIYDKSFPNVLNDGKYYALRWLAHDASNELLTFNKLNHAKNYTDYVSALSTYDCPGQNFVFAAKSGDIAIRQQGKFPAKWQRQGDFIMPGSDSSYAWQGFIPSTENPAMLNPARAFVSSANQLATDKNYPYYLAGRPFIYRGIIINRWLSRLSNITIKDMQQMQTDDYDVFAETARPLLLKYLNTKNLSADEANYINKFTNWNLRSGYNEEGPTILDKWWRALQKEVFSDEFAQTKLPLRQPDNSTLLEGLLKDSAYKFVDDISTPAVEHLTDIVSSSFKQAAKDLDTAGMYDYLAWGKYKSTGAKHPLNIAAFSRMQLPVGGNVNSINATARTNGPSWRMIVELTKDTEAYGIYPGGQSGNPGSKYYDNFVDNWAAGKYYKLLFFKKEEAQKNGQIKWKMTFSKA
jgi:penicillin amidase